MSRVAPRNKSELHLPFNDEWLCFWGGDTVQLNYHRAHNYPDQRFAFDFVKVDESGSFYDSRTRANDRSYSFGQPVLAPAHGLIVDVVDELEDSEPGKADTSAQALGNFILIRHKEAEYSVLAHLKQGSAAVKLAQTVEAGEVIAACGNSGRSTDPHLHYHLQTSARLWQYNDESRLELAIGVKPSFTKISRARNGVSRTVKNYSPIKGDVVGNA